LRLSDFDYYLPKELIAQRPLAKRDTCRLLVVDRKQKTVSHKKFKDLKDYLKPGDCMALNDTKVVLARLIGHKASGGKVDILLTEQKSSTEFQCLVNSSRPIKKETEVFLKSNVCVTLANGTGKFKAIRFQNASQRRRLIEDCGCAPLPPYIKRLPDKKDRSDYQTVYARRPGAIASPTAGLHFTKDFLSGFRKDGIDIAYLTLHVGLGTFQPVECEDVTGHQMHREWIDIPAVTADKINKTRKNRARIIAVGTTVCRALESSAAIRPTKKWTDLFIYPGHRFKFVDALITNFHLPKTTLLMLVSAFCGRDLLLKAYAEAVKKKYRFYSYGDAMLIV